MLALGAMATWNRLAITIPCIESYLNTCSPAAMELHIVDNGSTDGLAQWLKDRESQLRAYNVFCHYNSENVGTAAAINSIWCKREPTQHCLKIDSDVVWLKAGWFDRMLDVFDFTSNLGIIGLKRDDLWENPNHSDPFYRSEILTLVKDGREVQIEQVNHVIGTCWLVRSTLINSVGALFQPGKYGFDDALYCIRAKLAGFAVAFLCGEKIQHIDPGEAGSPENGVYTRLKHTMAGLDLKAFENLRDTLQQGKKGYYFPFTTVSGKKEDDYYTYTAFQDKDSKSDLENEGLTGVLYE